MSRSNAPVGERVATLEIRADTHEEAIRDIKRFLSWGVRLTIMTLLSTLGTLGYMVLKFK